jgi:hypothetical protein
MPVSRFVSEGSVDPQDASHIANFCDPLGGNDVSQLIPLVSSVNAPRVFTVGA